MAKYKKEDYSNLLVELRSEKAANDKKTALNGIGWDEIPEKTYKWYLSQLKIVEELLLHGTNEKIDYSDVFDTVLDMFGDIDSKRTSFWKTLEDKLGCYDPTENARIVSWLHDLKSALSRWDEQDVIFYSERLLEKTNLCSYIANFSNKKNDTSEPVKIENTEAKPIISEKLHKLLSDEKIRYIYDTKENMIHDKTCGCVKNLSDDSIEGLDKYIKDAKTCEKCEIKAYIRAGANDVKEYDNYIKLLDLMGADKDTIKRMYIDLGFSTKLSNMHTEGYSYSNYTNNAITIWYKEDTWRIGLTDKKHVRLEHNNYKPLPDKKREFTKGFHIQNELTHSCQLSYALKIIKEYCYEDHYVEKAASKEKNIGYLGKLQTYIPVQEETSFFKRLVYKIKKFLFPDRISSLREKELKPAVSTICLYQWIDDNGDKHWNSGIYVKKRNRFQAIYGNTAVEVPYAKVIKWTPIDNIEID